MKHRLQQNHQPSSDLIVTLYELLQGKRHIVKVYSRALQSDLCFVNTERIRPEELLRAECPVYSTRELATIISLSPDEFRRFHYLKTRLVG